MSRRWLVSFGLALALHAGVLALLEVVRPWSARPARAVSTPIELVFAPVEPPPTSADQPRHFTELPEDRADVAPEQADALSNVDSRARDRVEGGEETSLPRLEGESEAPAIEMVREQTESLPPTAGQEGEDVADRAEAAPDEPDGQTGDASDALQESQRMAGDPRRELLQGAPEPTPETELLELRRDGDSEVEQEATANPGGNAPLFGDLTLNTTAWEWAPWMQRFSRDFHRNWRPPFAYIMGVIHGKHRVRVEVAKDGKLLSVDLLEEQGHESLAQASLANLNGIAPLAPLPDNFPEETLILQLTITYREWKANR